MRESRQKAILAAAAAVFLLCGWGINNPSGDIQKLGGSVNSNTTFPTLAPDGSAAAASYSFATNPNSGMAQSGNSLVFYVRGGQALALDPNLLATFKALNATGVTGELQFQGNTVYESDGSSVYLSPSNDTTGALYVFTGGAQRLQITNAGATTFSNNVTANANMTVAGLLAGNANMTLTGRATIGNLTNNGNTTVAGTMAVTGATTLTGNLAANANATVAGDLAVTGTLTAGSLAQNTNITLSPNSLYFGWTGSRAHITSTSTDGQINVSKNDGSQATAAGNAVCFGTAACVGLGNTTGRIRVQNNAGTGITFEATQVACTTTPCGFTDSASTNGYFNDASGVLRMASGSANSETWDSSGNANHIRGNEIVQNGNRYVWGTDTALERLGAGSARVSDNSTGFGTMSAGYFVVAKTGNYTILPADVGKIFTNTGAAGSITLTLPACTVNAAVSFAAQAAFTTILAAAGSDVITVPGLAQTLKTQITSPATGSGAIRLACVATGFWQPLAQQTGTWTSN